MENRELKSKDMVGYLPDLKVLYFCGDRLDNAAGDIISVSAGMVNVKFEEGKPSSPLGFSNIKPILRPLSDLYRTITHNGEEDIPIVSLAKIAFQYLPDWAIKGNKAVYYNQYGNIEFYYDDRAFKAYRHDEGFLAYINQYHLFDYLHELKIDYRGLIDAGLVISVHDLSENPYK